MTDELIKRSEVLRDIEDYSTIDEFPASTVLRQLKMDVKNISSVDAVPVVRCSTCRYYDKRNDPSGETSGSYPYCHRFCDYIDVDGYCKWGKRKDGKGKV